MATARPENSPTSCRSPPRRGNCSPTLASHSERLPIARRVSTVSASSSASSTLSFEARRARWRMSRSPPNGGFKPELSASTISVVSA